MPEYFAFYGSLMDSANDKSAPSRAGLVRYAGACRLAGVLLDHGDYPGLVLPGRRERRAVNPSIVKAELFEIVRPHAFIVFDRWEDYDPDDEANSLYVRRKIRLLEPDVEAWVYLSQISRDDPVVPNGDWAAHRKADVEYG